MNLGHGTCIHPNLGGTLDLWNLHLETRAPVEVHIPEREFCIIKIWKLTGLPDEQPAVQLCAKRSRAPGQFFNFHFFTRHFYSLLFIITFCAKP